MSRNLPGRFIGRRFMTSHKVMYGIKQHEQPDIVQTVITPKRMNNKLLNAADSLPKPGHHLISTHQPTPALSLPPKDAKHQQDTTPLGL